MIELRNVSKGFKGIELFRDVSLCIPDGKKIFIKGTNGSGKSVLLKMIIGFSRPDSRQILVNGEEVGKKQDFIPNAGICINAPEFVGNVSGYDNLMELAKIRKIAGKEEIMALCERFGLAEHIHKKYGKYSLGMKQKMRLIQAFMEKPDILILDEPFDALDKTSR